MRQAKTINELNMKRIIYIAILALTALAGCKKDEAPSLSKKICGEWRGSEISADAGIYISFASDGTFELYQKLSGEGFELRRGTWTLQGDILSGKYNDDEPWVTSYKVTGADNVLTLVAQDESAETNVYQKCEIPEYIKESSTVVVKSYCNGL